MVKIDVRIRDLVAIYGSQKATAKKLGISQSYVSRLMNRKRGKKFPLKLKKKVNSRWRYFNNRYYHQPQIKIKVDAYDHPIWISGELVELDDLDEAYKMLEKKLSEAYDTHDLVLSRVRTFNKKSGKIIRRKK